jgi:hypothetical protein
MRSLPIGRVLALLSTRSSLVLQVGRHLADLVEEQREPPSAIWKRPSLSIVAPVNAPFVAEQPDSIRSFGTPRS